MAQRILQSTVTACLALPLASCAAGDRRDDTPPKLSTDEATASLGAEPSSSDIVIGEEKAVSRHLSDGEERKVPLAGLLDHGGRLFSASWTIQDGQGRPLSKGTGAPLSRVDNALIFPNNFNRISAPDANSCAGCHNLPYGVPGGGGDIVTNVFVLGQRFDRITFDTSDDVALSGAVDEAGDRGVLETIGNQRATPGLFGAGYIEMLARQMSVDLRAIRDGIVFGGEASLSSNGVDFGTLRRRVDGTWDTTDVVGLVAPSLKSSGPDDPPILVIRPFHQASNVVSLRQFTNNAFNHHHGIQSTERFGAGADPDGDGFVDELTRADVTAATLYQATLAVPGRMIPRHPEIEAAVWNGEQLFESIGCAECHRTSLPLTERGWHFVEPGPFNPSGNMQPGDGAQIVVDLNSKELPLPRLRARDGIVEVPAYTDLKVHDITFGPEDPNREPLDMNAEPGSESFKAGNGRFLTRRLWGVANEPPYFHHGKYTTLREAVLAHAGEAARSADAFRALSNYDRGSVIEFLKSLRVLAPGTKHRVVDERGRRRRWPPRRAAR